MAIRDKQIQVEHIWTHEKVWLPIEVVQENYISVRWSLSGVYDIYLSKTRSYEPGMLIARSTKARLRNVCLWRVVDLDEARRFAYETLNPEQTHEQVTERMAAYERSKSRYGNSSR